MGCTKSKIGLQPKPDAKAQPSVVASSVSEEALPNPCQPSNPPSIWVHGVVEASSESWTNVYRRLQHKPYGEALLSLCDLPMRNWAQKWAAAQESCQVSPNDIDLEQPDLDMVDTIREIVGSFHTTHNISSTRGIRQQLKLQEQFLWMAKLIVTGLTGDHTSLLHHVYFSLTQRAESDVSPQHTCNWITTGEESDFSKLRTLFLKGVELNGAFFRLIVEQDDWRAVRHQCRVSKHLVVAVEGSGMRIAASAILPPDQDIGSYLPLPRGISKNRISRSKPSQHLFFHFAQSPTPGISSALPGTWIHSTPMDIFGAHVHVYFGPAEACESEDIVIELDPVCNLTNRWTMADLQRVMKTLGEKPFARYDHAVRDALHEHNLPARAAIGLLGCTQDQVSEAILVEISCDVVACSAKKLLRARVQPSKSMVDFENRVNGFRSFQELEEHDSRSNQGGNFIENEVSSILDAFFPTPCWSRMLLVVFWLQAARGLPRGVDAAVVLESWVKKAYALAMQAPTTLARTLAAQLSVQVHYAELRNCLRDRDPRDHGSFPTTFACPRNPVNLIPMFLFKELGPIALNDALLRIEVPRTAQDCQRQVRYALSIIHSDFFDRHQILHIRVALKTVKWVLLAYFTPTLREEVSTVELASALDILRGLLAHVSILLSNLANCPPELLAMTWALRGYCWEIQCEVDVCFMDYLQALQIMEETWGDPRVAGKDSYGHPFVLLLTWKLGQIAYMRSDVKNIDKFTDIFRALRRHWGSPFAWSPPFELEGACDVPSPDDQLMGRSMCHMETYLRMETDDVLKDFYNKFDPLDFASGLHSTPQIRKKPISDGVMGGTVFSCGSNVNGQLGVGPPLMSNAVSKDMGHFDLWWSGRPLRLMLDLPVKQVSCADNVSAIVTDEGVYLWGEFYDRVYSVPKKVEIPVGVAKIACGARFLLMMDTLNGLWSMGNGHDGVLGLGCAMYDSVEHPVRLDFDGDVKDICCGAYHALCVDHSGKMWTWGRNEGGQLGHSEARLAELHDKNVGSFFEDDTVVPEPVEVCSSEEFAFASCGQVHCAAVDIQGRVWCWGWGEFGQLGNGISQTSLHKMKSVGGTGAVSKRFVPELIRPGYFNARISQIAGGGNFTLAVTEVADDVGGKVFSFGGNEWGQCGFPAKNPYDVDTPTLIEALEHTQIVFCAAGHNHALAFDSQGHVYAWGNSQYGQIGNVTPPKFLASPPVIDPRWGNRRVSDADSSVRRKTYAMHDTPRLIQSVAKLRMSSGACGGAHSLILHAS